METGSITAWTAYNAAAKITMPRTSMHQSQNLNQSQVGVGIRGNVVHHMTYDVRRRRNLSFRFYHRCVEFSRRLSRTEHGHHSRCRSSSYTYKLIQLCTVLISILPSTIQYHMNWFLLYYFLS